MSLAGRARIRPVLYPAAILLAFVLNFVVETEVSPHAAVRPIIIAVVVGLSATWVAGLFVGDRDVAGLVGAILALLVLSGRSPAVTGVGLAALALIAAYVAAARRGRVPPGAARRLLPLATRFLTASALIFLVAVGIKSLQGGGLAAVRDLFADSPLRVGSPAGETRPGRPLPSMYFMLLDGYPRADKLRSEFAIDNTGFLEALEGRGFVVAARSRSNHTSTRATLTQMFNYELAVGSVDSSRQDALWRRRINEGRFLGDLRTLGYEVVAVSPGLEHVALRGADRFIDPGPVNDFELAVLKVTGAGLLAEIAEPELVAEAHRARVIRSFDAAEALAAEDARRPRFVFTHVPSPHPPLVFNEDGSRPDVGGIDLTFEGRPELIALGWAEYARRLGGQVRFLNARTLHAIDAIIARDPGAVVVVFSDHGPSVRSDPSDHFALDADVRTANLLAVRAPGRTGIIEDRSTLANLLPRLLRAYAGTGPADVPEVIYAWADHPAMSAIFDRPD